MQRYRKLISITAFLGVLFAILQGYGFISLSGHGVLLLGQGSNPSASFLAIITGLHILHVLAGVVVLVVIFKGIQYKIQSIQRGSHRDRNHLLAFR